MWIVRPTDARMCCKESKTSAHEGIEIKAGLDHQHVPSPKHDVGAAGNVKVYKVAMCRL